MIRKLMSPVFQEDLSQVLRLEDLGEHVPTPRRSDEVGTSAVEASA